MAGATPNTDLKTLDFTIILEPVLDAFLAPLEAAGAAVISLGGPGGTPIQLFKTGSVPAVLLGAEELLAAGSRTPSCGLCPDTSPVLAGPWHMSPTQPVVVVFWREPGAKSWKKPDHPLVLMVAATLDAVLKSVSPPPREAPRRGIADIVTGLPKARKFVSDLLRHFARLDREGLAGSIMVVSIDGYTQLNACLGRKGISQVLLQIAALLNRISRPSDAVGRIDDDKFAVWLNGADHFTAAERAEQLGLNTSHSLAAASRGMPVSFSVGIAARRPGSKETVNLLLQRADRAMREARKIGPGLWRVAQDGVITGS